MAEKGKFILPKLHHVGIAVKDVEAAAEYYYSNFGIGPFMIFDVDLPDVVILRQRTRLKLKVGIGQMGDIYLELVQALEEGSPAWELVYRRGEGLYHLRFLVDDLSQALAQLEKQGFKGLESAGKGKNRFAFVGSRKSEGVLLELMQLESDLIS
ncbi:MAG: VOC family protein [Dehalococcoidia bacterium]|nr:MAG: VOC family protein [Dehalococcoidia bacterium]